MSRWQSGDTLVEVALALAILAFVLVGSIAVAARAFRLGGAARETTTASNLIQQQAEALRNYRDDKIGNWSTVVSATNGTFYMSNIGGTWTPVQGTQTSGLYTYSIVRSPGPQANEFRFDITATWLPAGNGPPNSLTISTYLVDLDNLQPCDNSNGACTAAAPTASITANPTSIPKFTSSTLSWATTNATTITLNGTIVAASGTEVVSPAATTTYTLVATGLGGTATASVTVTVTAPLGPTIVHFGAAPNPIYLGDTTTLSWATINASSATLSANGQDIGVGTAGSYQVSPIINTVYTLAASGPGGTTSQSVTVTVNQPANEARPAAGELWWLPGWTNVVGRVTYADGVPLANVTLALCDWGLGGGVYLYTNTDADGYFNVAPWYITGSGAMLCVRIAGGNTPNTGGPTAINLQSPNIGDGSYECQLPGVYQYNGDSSCNSWNGWDLGTDDFYDFTYPTPTGLNL